MDAYSMDLRERVVRACDGRQGTQAQIAQRFGVSTSFITKLLRRRRQTGSFAPKPHGGGRRPTFDRRGLERLRRSVAAHPDATLAQRAVRSGTGCSPMAVWRALVKLGISRKKRVSAPPSRTGPM